VGRLICRAFQYEMELDYITVSELLLVPVAKGLCESIRNCFQLIYLNSLRCAALCIRLLYCVVLPCVYDCCIALCCLVYTT